MTLDPQAQTVVDMFAAAGVRGFAAMSPTAARFMFDLKAGQLNLPTEDVAAVEKLSLPGPAGPLEARLYRPAAEAERGPLPLLVFFHGGGYVIGSLKSHDPQCRRLANAVPCLLLSVAYRLAPEAPFPAAVDDAWAALRWAAENAAALGARPGPVALAGDSAGGNLAAVASRIARDEGGPDIALQVLAYPNTDLFADLPSHALFDENLLLTRETIDWFVGHYLTSEADRADPRFAPLRVADVAGLPPAVIVTGEYDPLRDEGAAYAERLREAGVPVEYTCFPGQVHNFLVWGGVIDAAGRALDRMGAALRRAWQT